MNTTHHDTIEHPAITLGLLIRTARKKSGLTIAELGERIGRPREWMNRVELGYSQDGNQKPPSQSDLRTIFDNLSGSFSISLDQLLDLGKQSEQDFDGFRQNARPRKHNTAGKLTQTEVIIGEEQIVSAIVDLINEQHSDAIIRNTGIKGSGNNPSVTENWKMYRDALGVFLTKYPHAIFKRVEYAASGAHLEVAKETDIRVAGTRKTEDVHNAKVKFHKLNPMQLHVLIGQREAILCLPHTSGQVGSNMALLIRDKIFVEALRVWYDEVLWDAPGENRHVDFSRYNESFDAIRAMYGFDKPSAK